MDPTSNSAPIFSSGGASAEPSGPISSGTGDIVLSPTPTTGKSKKGIVVVIIILIVLALGGLGVWYLQQNGIGGNSKGLFQEYAGYLLSGGNDIADKYNDDAEYYLDKAIASDGVIFLDKLKDLYSKFERSTANNNFDNILSTEISNYTNYFYAFYSYYYKEALPVDDILAKFYETDYDATKQYIKDYYVEIPKFDNESAEYYWSIFEQEAYSELDTMEIFKACIGIEKGELHYDQSCVSKTKMPNDLAEKIMSQQEDIADAKKMKADGRESLLRGAIWLSQNLGANND